MTIVRRNERGITLIELMVVLVIIAIIAGIVIALYQDLNRKTRLVADKGTGAAIRSALSIYYSKHDGNFPTKAMLSTLVQPSPPVFQCPGQDYTVNANTGEIALTVNDAALC